MVHIDQKHQVRRSWYFLQSIVWVGSPGYCLFFARVLATSLVTWWMAWGSSMSLTHSQDLDSLKYSWSHTFEGGVWPEDENWVGDLDDFEIIEASLPGSLGPYALQLRGDEAGNSILARRQERSFGTWSFLLQQRFISSSVNRHYIMLFVDDSVSRDGLNGYGLTSGGSGDERRFTLFRLDDGERFTLLHHPVEVLEGTYRVTITRDDQFEWSLQVDDLSTRDQPTEGSGHRVTIIDSLHTHARFFGIRFRYTSTRKEATTLDDLRFSSGSYPPSVEVDEDPPFVYGAYYGSITADTLFILISEPLDQPTIMVNTLHSTLQAIPRSEQVWTLRMDKLQNWRPGIDPLSLERLQDWSGNYAFDVEVPYTARYPDMGDLIVTESMIRPNEDDYDGRPNQSQYIEVFNTTDEWLWVPGITYHMGWKEDGTAQWKESYCVQCIKVEGFSAQHLPPYSYGVLFPEPLSSFQGVPQSRIAKAHSSMPTSIPFWQIDAKTMSFRSTENVLFLAVKFNKREPNIVDSVRLMESSHHPLLPTTKGIALERLSSLTLSSQHSQEGRKITTYLDGWDPTHWVSSAHWSGGSPGLANQTQIDQQESNGNGWVQLFPTSFSPNQDGLDDVLSVEYVLPVPDYLLDVSIFNIQGVPIVQLSRGRLAGAQGTLMWKGWMDDGTVVPAGLYLLHVRAYGSSLAKPKTVTKLVGVYR